MINRFIHRIINVYYSSSLNRSPESVVYPLSVLATVEQQEQLHCFLSFALSNFGRLCTALSPLSILSILLQKYGYKREE